MEALSTAEFGRGGNVRLTKPLGPSAFHPIRMFDPLPPQDRRGPRADSHAVTPIDCNPTAYAANPEGLYPVDGEGLASILARPPSATCRTADERLG